MSAQKTRLTISLDPHAYAVISELSSLQGKPKSKLITEFLDSVIPVFERTCYLISLANRATSGAKDDVRLSMERSEAKLKQMMDDAMGQMDMLAEGLSEASGGGSFQAVARSDSDDGEERTRSAKAGHLPPHSNTGVTPKPRRKTPKKSATKRNP